MRIIPTILALLLVLPTGVAAQSPEVAVTPLADGMYRIDGAIDNIVISTGDDGLLMLDTGYEFAAPGVRSVLQELAGTDEPDVLLNTHHHHAFANHVYAGQRTTIIAHEAALERMAGTTLMAGVVLEPFPTAGWPDTTFRDTHTFRFNGDRVRMVHVPGAHTDNDVVVWFQDSGVLAAGDVYVPHQPWISLDAGASVQGLVNALEFVIERFPEDTRVVPGHDPVTATMDDVRAFRAMIVAAADSVRARIGRGLTLRMVQQLGLPDDLARWEGDAVSQEFFLESLYRSLVPVRQTPSPTLAFANGRWFVQGRFEEKTMYSVNGVLRETRPARVDSVVDLAGGWVVPPFGEAHTHRLANPAGLAADHRAFLEAGVFYAMVQDPITELTPRHRELARESHAVDVAYTQGVITPSEGTIPEMYTIMAEAGQFGDGVGLADLDGRLLFRLDSAEDVAAHWPEIEALNQRFVKIILAFSGDRERRVANPDRFPSTLPTGTAAPGVRAEVLRAVVQRAHDAGLAVSAHIETVADYRLAIDAGVDWIAHVPASWQIGPETGFEPDNDAPWLLTPGDAFASRRARVPVVTTTVPGDPDDPRRPAFDSVHTHNLTVLKEAGAPLALGSDLFNGTAVEEAIHLRRYGVFTDAELLTLLAVQTPRLIFPERRIGHLRGGYEASFLVLGGDPTADLAFIHDIQLRVKNGAPLR